MTAKNLVIEIPYEIISEAKLPPKRARDVIKQELAIHLYQEGILSFGNARKLAEMDKLSFHFMLGERNIVRDYDLDDYQDDKEEVAKWQKK
jgi:predicted HTH domain antitoxin